LQITGTLSASQNVEGGEGKDQTVLLMALTGGIYLESPMSLSANRRYVLLIPMCILCFQKICFRKNLGNTPVQDNWLHCGMAVPELWLQAGHNCMKANMIC